MLLDRVTDAEMQAARVLTGATMVLLLAAPLFRRWAQHVRLATTVCYILGIVLFLICAVCWRDASTIAD